MWAWSCAGVRVDSGADQLTQMCTANTQASSSPGVSTNQGTLPCLLAQFNRLERVDVGGARGHLLTSSVRAVHSDFLLAAQRFVQVMPARAVCLVDCAVPGDDTGVDGVESNRAAETFASPHLSVSCLCSWSMMSWMWTSQGSPRTMASSSEQCRTWTAG